MKNPLKLKILKKISSQKIIKNIIRRRRICITQGVLEGGLFKMYANCACPSMQILEDHNRGSVTSFGKSKMATSEKAVNIFTRVFKFVLLI